MAPLPNTLPPAASVPEPPGAHAPPAAIEVVGLSKRYGDVDAVSDVSFSVAPGEVFAFLGPNGAGKSTAIKILCTLVHPTGGSARVAGLADVGPGEPIGTVHPRCCGGRTP